MLAATQRTESMEMSRHSAERNPEGLCAVLRYETRRHYVVWRCLWDLYSNENVTSAINERANTLVVS